MLHTSWSPLISTILIFVPFFSATSTWRAVQCFTSNHFECWSAITLTYVPNYENFLLNKWMPTQYPFPGTLPSDLSSCYTRLLDVLWVLSCLFSESLVTITFLHLNTLLSDPKSNSNTVFLSVITSLVFKHYRYLTLNPSSVVWQHCGPLYHPSSPTNCYYLTVSPDCSSVCGTVLCTE